MTKTDTVFYVEELLNLLVSLVGLAWALGADRKRRDVFAYPGWLVFWGGTIAFYAAEVVNKRLHYPLPWWGPQLGLYVATLGLLSAYVLSETVTRPRSTRWALVGVAAAVVVTAAGTDIALADRTWLARWHQALTCFAILPWAFRLRHQQPSRSIAMAVYALIQLPFYQVSPEVRKLLDGSDAFNEIMFGAYLVGKIPLISAVHYALLRPDARLLKQYAAAAPRSEPPTETNSWDVFISYAFEDLECARALRQALAGVGVRGFVASEDLRAEAGVGEWSEVIDQVLDATPSLVVLMSPEALDSPWVTYEWRSVHQEILSGRGQARLIPICLRGLSPEQLPRGLKRYLCVNWNTLGGCEAGALEIAPRIAHELSQRAPAN